MALPLHAILKAALALCLLTVDELSLATTIRSPRVRAILAGRQTPTALEVKRILRACGVRPSYGTPRSILGGHRSVDDVMWGLLVARSASSSVTPRGTLLIDKVSLTFNVIPAAALVSLLESQAERLPLGKRGSHYAKHYRFRGVFVQHGFPERHDRTAHSYRRRTSRLEFNPAKLDTEGRSFVREVLRLATLVRLSKIDVAVDYAADHVVQAISAKRKHVRLFIGSGGIETHYVGAPASEVQLRIYDKALLEKKKRAEALAKGSAVDSPIIGPLTRFEAAHANVKTPLSKLADLPNPFRDLRLVILDPRDAPFGLRLTIQFARAFGIQAIRAFTDADEYKQIVATIERHVDRPAFHPAETFESRWRDVAADLLPLISLRSDAT